MKLPVQKADLTKGRARTIRDADGVWVCEAWDHDADQICAALNTTRPEVAATKAVRVALSFADAVEAEIKDCIENGHSAEQHHAISGSHGYWQTTVKAIRDACLPQEEKHG